MKRVMLVTVWAGLVMGAVSSTLFAAIPDLYDFKLETIHLTKVSDSYTVGGLSFDSNDTISFDYWFDPIGPAGMLNGGIHSFLTLSSPQVTAWPEIFEEHCYLPSDSWRTDTFGFGPLTFSGGNSMVFNLGRCIMEEPDPEDRDYEGLIASDVYIRNVRVIDGDNVQPVPEPGTWALMGMGFVSLLGFEIRKRKLK